MKHLAGNLLDVHVAGLEDPIGVTDTHPFWSEERQTFVPAGQLQVGEHLRRADGTLAQITRIAPRRGPPEVVYNLEVDGEHVFHVTADGVLVHNSCANGVPDGGYPRGFPTKRTNLLSATFESEGAARQLAREKLGQNPVNLGDNKLRSIDGRWQYRAKPIDTTQNHVHLERLDPATGEVLEDWHLNWPEGTER